MRKLYSKAWKLVTHTNNSIKTVFLFVRVKQLNIDDRVLKLF